MKQIKTCSINKSQLNFKNVFSRIFRASTVLPSLIISSSKFHIDIVDHIRNIPFMVSFVFPCLPRILWSQVSCDFKTVSMCNHIFQRFFNVTYTFRSHCQETLQCLISSHVHICWTIDLYGNTINILANQLVWIPLWETTYLCQRIHSYSNNICFLWLPVFILISKSTL